MTGRRRQGALVAAGMLRGLAWLLLTNSLIASIWWMVRLSGDRSADSVRATEGMAGIFVNGVVPFGGGLIVWSGIVGFAYVLYLLVDIAEGVWATKQVSASSDDSASDAAAR